VRKKAFSLTLHCGANQYPVWSSEDKTRYDGISPDMQDVIELHLRQATAEKIRGKRGVEKSKIGISPTDENYKQISNDLKELENAVNIRAGNGNVHLTP
jgi:hypothetical protein